MNINLDREQALDLVALLTQLSSLSRVWFRNHEPASSRASELSKEILGQLVKQESVTTEVLRTKCNTFQISGLDMNTSHDNE